MKSRGSLKFGQIGAPIAELGALEHMKKSSYTYSGGNGVAAFSQLFLVRYFSYLHTYE